jgi:hypothetical protein
MTMSCVKRARQGTTAGADEYVTGSRATEVSDRLRAACGARHDFSRQAVADILRERAAGGGRRTPRDPECRGDVRRLRPS